MAVKQVHYKVKITDPAHHLAQVSAQFPPHPAGHFQVKMAAWRTGRYQILNLANGISDLKMFDDQARPLAVQKVDKQTWRTTLPTETAVRVEYQLYANQLKNRSRHIDDSHAFLDASGVLVYAPAFRQNPITLSLAVPPQWQSVSGLQSGLTPHSFSAANFDELVDAPVESGIHQLHEFNIDNKTIQLAIWGQGNYDSAQIVQDLKLLIPQGKKIWGDYPFERYLFILHATSNATGATEHKNSSVIQLKRFSFNDDKGYQRWLQISAHEFVHTWNVKAYRPAGISPYDYSQENYSRLLWIAEGSTSYLSPLMLLRAGLIDVELYLQDLAEAVDKYLNRPGRFRMSASEASFDQWIGTRGDRANNAAVNIYSKGALLSLMLDFELRRLTQLKKGYENVHRRLYQDHRLELTGTGYRAEDVLFILKDISQHDFHDFWKNYVDGVQAIDFDGLFAQAGLRLSYSDNEDQTDANDTKKDAKTKPWLGISLNKPALKEEAALIHGVQQHSPAWQAGLTPGDIIVAVNGMQVNSKNFKQRVQEQDASQAITLHYFRRAQLSQVAVTPIAKNQGKAKLLPVIRPNKAQKAFYKKWLGTQLETKP